MYAYFLALYINKTYKFIKANLQEKKEPQPNKLRLLQITLGNI